MVSSIEIKKNIINSVLEFSLNIDEYRNSGQYSQTQINEMLSLGLEVNNLINLLDKDSQKIKYSGNLVKPKLTPTELGKMKRVLDLYFKYDSDINSIAIDIGENLSTTNRHLGKGIEYIFFNLKNKDFKLAQQATGASPAQQAPQRPRQQVPQRPKPAVGLFSYFFFIGVLVAMSVFLYNTFFDKPATRVTSLVKEYRSDKKLSSVTRPQSSRKLLKVAGTRSVLNIFYQHENYFKNLYPKLNYEVDSGDSGIAIRDLIDGDVSLAASSRIPSVAERKKALKRGFNIADHKIALDSVVFFVNKKNPVSVLSLDEIKEIYKSQFITWKQATKAINPSNQKISRFSLSKQSGTFSYFIDRVMYGEPSSNEVIHIYTPDQMLEMVSANPHAIGFCSLSVFKNENMANRDMVKIIRVSSIFDDNGTKPVASNGALNIDMIKRGEYPLTRYLYLVSAGNLTDRQAKFIDFMRSTQAQASLNRFGLVGIL